MSISDQDLAGKIWEYMSLKHPLEKADIIIGLGSFYKQTADWCAKLWQDGLAPKIIFCGNTGTFSDSSDIPEAKRYSLRAQELGVDPEAIIVEPDSTNTGENIIFAHRKLQSIGIEPTRVILVTLPGLLRRGYATAMKQWPTEKKPEFLCSGEPMTFNQYVNLPDSELDIIDILVGNLGRMRTFAEAGYQIEQDIPEDLWDAYNELIERGYDKYVVNN